MLRGHNILCISSIDWSEHWQVHHELMSRLAAQGNRVLYIENTGVRGLRVADFPRVQKRIRSWWHSTKGFRVERENLFVYSPLFLPFPYSRIAGWINRVLLFRALKRWMQATGFTRPIVLTFLPTPLARSLIEQVSPKAVFYFCADDFSSSSAAARRVTASEARLIKDADLVFATSERLRARAKALGGRVHQSPAGVDFVEFERVRDTNDPLPEDLARLKRPVIGYVGGLHQWVDQSLLVDLATSMPDASFALVGPSYTDVSRLEAVGNIHLLGQRPHADMPRYIKGFNVGLVPYRVSDYTASVYPVKLNEYLAMGIPVVATDLPEIRRFNDEHGHVISIACDATGFAAAIASAIPPAADAIVASRIGAARQNSWDARMDKVNQLMEQVLADRDARGERWEERLTRIYRVARGRTLQVVGAIVLTWLLLFETPFIWWLGQPLKVEAAPQRADAIVVFGGGVGESGQAGGGYQERVRDAVELYRQGYAPVVVFSSGFRFVFREAEVMKGLAIENGVPADAIVLENAAANTHENVRLTYDILRQHGWHRILLVSSPYHMRRALLTWRGSAPEIDVIPTPVRSSLFYTHERGASLDQIRGILQEYVAILAYWSRGWL